MPRIELRLPIAAAAAVALAAPAAASAAAPTPLTAASATTRVLEFEGAPWAFMPNVPGGEEAHEAQERAEEAERAREGEPDRRGPREGAPIRELPSKAQAKGLGDTPATAGRNPRSATRTATRPDFSVPSSFDGPGLADANAFPPDSMADVGPTQVLVTVNGRLRSYSKATGLPDGAVDVDTDAFFSSVMSGYTSDPRVRYDRRSGRWFVVMIDVPNSGANHVLLAVSDGPTLTSSTVWHFSRFDPKGVAFADYPTLGIDGNALYIGAVMFDASTFAFLGSQAYVVRKSDVLAGAATPTVTKFDLNALSVPQGVDAIDDSAGGTGYFVGVDSSAFSVVDVVRVSNPGGTPTLGAPQKVTVPTTTYPQNVTSGTATLDALDDRLFAATLRGGSIWTAHNIEVNAAGGASGSGNRDGSRWYQLDVSAATPSLVQSGTVFDPAASGARSYWIPSVTANGQGHMVIGGSVASATSPPNAWYAARLKGDPLGQTGAPVALTTATGSYTQVGDTGNPQRWGDYSYTSVDPTDDMTFWTIQEYAGTSTQWGVRVARVLAPPPATPLAGASAAPGSAAQTVTVDGAAGSDGAGFFDPGAGFPRRPSVSVGCGVVVTAVRVVSPTRLSLDLDTRGASDGTCDVTVTNPDGQTATGSGVLTLAEPAPPPPPTTTATTTATTSPPTTTTSSPPPATTTTTTATTTQTTTTTATATSARRCRVPKLRHRTVKGARKLLTRAHCRLGTVRRVRSHIVKRRRVVRSSPRAGRVLRAGTRVRIDVRR